jgi:protein subunit release factor A
MAKDELDGSSSRAARNPGQQDLLLPKDPVMTKDVIMEIRAGAMATRRPCLSDLQRMYTLRRKAELENGAHRCWRQRHRGRLLKSSEAVRGENAYGKPV